MTSLTRTATSGKGRHVARRGIRTLVSIRSMMMTAVTLLIAVCLAGVATGGTYALWNKSQPTGSNAVITSGNAELTVTSPLAMPTRVMYQGMPNPVLYGSAALKNTGTIPLTLRLTGLTVPTSNAFTQSLKVGVAIAADAAKCAGGTVSSAWVYGTFPSTAVAALGTVAVDQSKVVCVSVQFSATPDKSIQGQSALNFVVSVEGVQN
jgi:hypothetical protein